MPKVDIKVKNEGLLEVPEGKKVNELPLKHFEDLVDKKGYDKIIKGLNNLQVWNKNGDPKLSKWAEDMMEKLKKKFRPEETSSKNKYYIVHESIGNYSDKVFESDSFNEVQDYLDDRWAKYCEDEKVGLDDEKERELFDSYFHIEEQEIEIANISHPLKKGTKVKIDLDNGYAVWTVKRHRVRHDYGSDQDYYQYTLVKENGTVINDTVEKNITEVLKETEDKTSAKIKVRTSEYNVFKDLKKLPDNAKEWDFTDGNGHVFGQPVKDYSGTIKYEGKKFRYNYKTNELEWLDKDNSIIDSIGISLENIVDGIEYWIEMWMDDLDEQFQYELNTKTEISKNEEYDFDKLYEEFEKETLKLANETNFRDFATGYGDYEDGEDFQNSTLEDYIEPALEIILEKNDIVPPNGQDYSDLKIYEELLDKILIKAEDIITSYWEAVREEEDELEDEDSNRQCKTSGFHVGDMVKIKDSTSKDLDDIFEISDISYDTADDGSKIKMYNLYNLETEEILEEPYYEHELEFASKKDTNFKVGDKVRIKASPEKVYTIKEVNNYSGEDVYFLKELRFSIYSADELELVQNSTKERLQKAMKKIKNSAIEELTKAPKSKVGKLLDSLFPACDKEIRFPSKTVFDKEIFKKNLEKIKKEYLAQSSKRKVNNSKRYELFDKETGEYVYTTHDFSIINDAQEEWDTANREGAYLIQDRPETIEGAYKFLKSIYDIDEWTDEEWKKHCEEVGIENCSTVSRKD